MAFFHRISVLKYLIIRTVILFLLCINSFSIKAQSVDTDSTAQSKQQKKQFRQEKRSERRIRFLSTLPKGHNPKSATLWALLPGAGQIYNRRYWKLPIVYGGLGTLGYFTYQNYSEYQCFRRAYLESVDTDSTTNYICELVGAVPSSWLKIYRDLAQDNAETLLLLSVLFYGLTIVDAFVDAHLMHFDVNDDLSLKIEPQLNFDRQFRSLQASISLVFYPRARLESTRINF